MMDESVEILRDSGIISPDCVGKTFTAFEVCVTVNLWHLPPPGAGYKVNHCTSEKMSHHTVLY